MPLDAQSQAIVDGLNASGVLPFRQSGPIEMRQRIGSLRVPKPAASELEMASVTEETITTPDGSFSVRILKGREIEPGELQAAAIYFHGGGFFAGGLDETDELCRKIAKWSGVVVINVDYHLSPEARFPVAVNDAYASLCWVATNAERLSIDPARIVLVGDSAGANLTIVTSLMAREHGGPAVCFQVPIYPSLDMRERPQFVSRINFGSGGYILDNDDIEWMRKSYLRFPDDAIDWRASPILAESFAGLPPALVITADHDPLVDEGKIYADLLTAAGVQVDYACFEGTFHGFVGYASLLDVGARAIERICAGIQQATTH